MQEMGVRSLGWENPLEKEMATTHSSILTWEIHPMDRGACWATVHAAAKQSEQLNN